MSEDGVGVKYCARKRLSGKLRWLGMAWQGLAAVPRALRMNEVYIPYLGMAFWWCFTWTGCLGERNSAFLLERAKHLGCHCKANAVLSQPGQRMGQAPPSLELWNWSGPCSFIGFRYEFGQLADENFQDKPAEKPWKSCACFCFGSLILSSVGRFLWVMSANLFISYWQITVSPVKPGISVSPQCNSQMSDTVTAGLEPNWTGMLESFWSKSLWLWALCQWNDEVQQDDSNERALFRELDNSISVVLSFHLCSWVYCK